jgi:hypothetical protein
MGIQKWKPDIYIGFSPALRLQCIQIQIKIEFVGACPQFDGKQVYLSIHLGQPTTFCSLIRFDNVGSEVRTCSHS